MITFLDIGHMGQLGNQLFEFSALYALSIHLKQNIVLPIENIYTVIPDQKNKIYESHLELFECFKLDQNILYSKNSIIPEHYYNQPFFHFDENFWNISPNTSIKGYFQSEKYFSKYRNEILSCLEFHPTIVQLANDTLKLVSNSSEIVGIHVRRRDFVDHNIDLTSQYYLRCIEYMNSINNFNYFIVSDDISWCKNIFSGIKNVYFSLNTRHHVDLCILSLCHHNIICNSTFGWWGSWLNKNKNRITIAPKTWFPQTDDLQRYQFNCNDIQCQHWTNYF